jgi:hypothetical protein
MPIKQPVSFYEPCGERVTRMRVKDTMYSVTIGGGNGAAAEAVVRAIRDIEQG